MKYCPNCNHQLNDDDLFCEACGTRVEEAPEPLQAQPAQDPDIFNPYSDAEIPTEPQTPDAYETDTASDFADGSEPEDFAADAEDEVAVQREEDKGKNTITIGIDVQKAKKPLIIIGSLVVLLIVGLVVWHIVSDKINKAPIKISLSDYFSDTLITPADIDAFYDEENTDEYTGEYNEYEGNYPFFNLFVGAGLYVYGYNDYAAVDQSQLTNVIEWKRLIDDVNEKLSHKKTDRKESLTFTDFFDEFSFSFSVDKSEGLSNEQIVTVSATANRSAFQVDEVTIEVSDGEHAYKIDRLETVTAIDPFDYVNLVTYGPNGNAEVNSLVSSKLDQKIDGLDGFRAVYYSDQTVAIEKDGYIVNKIWYYMSEDYERCQNGDIVTMLCRSEGMGFEEEYHVYIARYSKEYTISGLGEYLSQTDKLSGDEISSFVSYAKQIINENYTSDSFSNIRFNSVYFADTKDKTNLPSYGVNHIYVVYSYDYTNWWDETYREYVYVRFDDIIISDGKLFKTASSYYDYYSGGNDDLSDLLLKFEDDGRFIVSKLETDA